MSAPDIDVEEEEQPKPEPSYENACYKCNDTYADKVRQYISDFGEMPWTHNSWSRKPQEWFTTVSDYCASQNCDCACHLEKRRR